MSNAAIGFGIYFAIGLLLMIVVLATRAKEKGLAGFEVGGGGDVVDAWLLIFTVLLWPVWAIVWLTKKEDEPKYRSEDPNRRS